MTKTVTRCVENRDEIGHSTKQTVTESVTSLSYHIPNGAPDPLDLLAEHLRGLSDQVAAAVTLVGTMRAERDATAADEQFPDDLIDLAVAAQEFDMEKDTLRKLCRDKRIGVKHAGTRWMVSVSKLRSLRQSR